MSIKTCIDCHQHKPTEEFYLRPDGRNYTSVCKSCMKIRSAENGKAHRSKFISSVSSENALLNALHQQGIPAWPGKAMSHAFADIVAWGVVRIEVKTAVPDERGRYIWHFTPSQVKSGIRGDIIALALDDHRYSLLPHDSVAFLRDGERKSAITYPNSRIGMRMVNEAIEQGIGNWGLIQTVRDVLCIQLQQGQYDVTERK